MAGGPPVRGELLGYWERSAEVLDDERRRWLAAALRIAAGVYELAHLVAVPDGDQLVLVFSCEGDAELAAAYARAIRSENVEARVVADDSGAVGVALPCAPAATDEEVRHVVLAVVKAAHVGAADPTAGAVAAQLETLQLAEQLVAGLAARVRSLGGVVRQGAVGAMRRG